MALENLPSWKHPLAPSAVMKMRPDFPWPNPSIKTMGHSGMGQPKSKSSRQETASVQKEEHHATQ